MIHGFSKNREMEKANSLLLDMEKEGSPPDLVSFNTLMQGFCYYNKISKVI